MTIVSTADQTSATSALVADFGGSDSSVVDVMIGVGLVKDSEAVFFQYQGDDKKVALFQDNGRPVTRIKNVCLTNIAIAEDIYKSEDGKGFDGSKLNLFLRTQSGATVMVTSGLTTMWSQCIVTALMGLYVSNQLSSVVQIDTFKGNSNLGTYFAAIRNNGIKATSQAMYDDLAAARASKTRRRT